MRYLLTLLLALTAVPAMAQSLPPALERCASCHSPQLPYPKAGVVIPSPETLVPGQPEKSSLWLAIQSDRMPPEQPLSQAEKQSIYNWIKGEPPVQVAAAPQADWQQNLVRGIGKTHLLVIHFPIALLIVSAFAEFFFRRQHWTFHVVHFCVVLGAFSAVTAALLGWMYGAGMPSTYLHGLLGTAATLLSIAVALALRHTGRSAFFRVLLLVTVLLLACAAHLGGVLVHGPW